MKGIVALVAALYPLLVYFGLGHYPVAALGLLLLVVAGLRLLAVGGDWRRLLPVSLAIALFAVAVMWTGSERLLRWYPLLVNLALLGWFGYTLWSPPSAIQRFSDLMRLEYPDQAIPYMVGVTWVWVIFFTVNAGIAAWTVYAADMKTWALYNGFIVYFVIGAIFAVEYVVRQAYRRRVEGG